MTVQHIAMFCFAAGTPLQLICSWATTWLDAERPLWGAVFVQESTQGAWKAFQVAAAVSPALTTAVAEALGEATLRRVVWQQQRLLAAVDIGTGVAAARPLKLRQKIAACDAGESHCQIRTSFFVSIDVPSLPAGLL